MYRSASRVISATSLPRALPRAHVSRRFVSTAPPHQTSRSWRNSALRWGLAGALVYYYNTATVFAEEPAYAMHTPPETSRENETYQTVASVSEQRRAQSRSDPLPPSSQSQAATVAVADNERPAPGSPGDLEEEASEQGAFNEETGEINWDCPCLGGMAHGPCGEQFRAAFSCFVFSKEEPKGVDCIEHFKTMQNCFREHPDVYGAELDDVDEASPEGLEGQAPPPQGEPAGEPIPAPGAHTQSAQSASTPTSDASTSSETHVWDKEPVVEGRQLQAAPAQSKVTEKHHPKDAADDAIPKAWHDSRSDNESTTAKESS